MNRPRNGRDWVALIVLMLVATLIIIVLVTVIGLVVFDKELSEEGGRLLSGVVLGIVAIVSGFIGSKIGHRGNGG